MAPSGRDDWHNRPIPGKRSFRALVYEYKRTFKKPGTYKIVCTLHEEMTMTIRVKRPQRRPAGS